MKRESSAQNKINDIEGQLYREHGCLLSPDDYNHVNDDIIVGHTSDGAVCALSQAQRASHVFCLGATGSLKSPFFESLFEQDMWSNRGCMVLEPHGDVSEHLLSETQPSRVRDTVFISPFSDLEYSPGVNPLALSPWASQDERATVVCDIMSTISSQMYMDDECTHAKEYLESALTALSWVPGATLLDVMNFYTCGDVRETVLECMPDGPDKRHIEDVTADASAASIDALGRRLGVFNDNVYMRRAFGQSRRTIDFNELVEQGYTILVSLKHGIVSTADVLDRNIFGSCVLSSIVRSKSKLECHQGKQKTFPILIDEFQDFVGDDVNGLLDACRERGISLMLANQYLAQLSHDELAAVGRCGTKMYMRVMDVDAASIAGDIGELNMSDLADISRFHVLMRTRTSDRTYSSVDTKWDKHATAMCHLDSEMSKEISDIVKKLSHERFMTKASAVDDEIELRCKLLRDGATRDQLAEAFC